MALRLSLLPFVTLALLAGCSRGGSSSSGPQAVPEITSSIKSFNSLPIISDGSSPSPDRVTINQVMARAVRENKNIVLEVSAAWCGPCTGFAMDMDAHPEYLSALSANGYIMVKAEYQRMVGTSAIDFMDMNDYLPAFIPGFPMFYIYSQNGGWIDLGSYSDYKSLNAQLQNRANLVPLSIAQIKSDLLSPSPGSMNRLLGVLQNNFTANYDYADAKTIIGILQSEASSPELAKMVEGQLTTYVAIGAISLSTLAKDYPTVALSMSDMSNPLFSTIYFEYEMASTWRTLGLRQTISQCASLWQNYRAQFTPGTLTASDFQAGLAVQDMQAEIICADLELQSTGPTVDVKQKFAKIDPALDKDWRLIAAMGDIQSAIAVYRQNYQSTAANINQDLTSANADLVTAKASGNQTQIAADTNAINTCNAMLKNLGIVDAQVEGDLKAGRPVKVLEVLN